VLCCRSLHVHQHEEQQLQQEKPEAEDHSTARPRMKKPYTLHQPNRFSLLTNKNQKKIKKNIKKI
jgi:hypothetical protein